MNIATIVWRSALDNTRPFPHLPIFGAAFLHSIKFSPIQHTDQSHLRVERKGKKNTAFLGCWEEYSMIRSL